MIAGEKELRERLELGDGAAVAALELLNKKDAKIDEYQGRVMELERALDGRMLLKPSELASIDSEIREKDARIAELLEDRDKLNARIAELERELDERDAKIADFAEIEAAITDDRDAWERDARKRSKRIAELEAEIARLRGALRTQTERVAEAGSRVGDLHAELEKRDAKIAALEAKLAELEAPPLVWEKPRRDGAMVEAIMKLGEAIETDAPEGVATMSVTLFDQFRRAFSRRADELEERIAELERSSSEWGV